MTRALVLAALVAGAIAPPVAAREPLLSAADSERIVRAVARLVQGNAGETRFVVIEDAVSGRYVQFASEGSSIDFDFPILAAAVRDAPRPLRDTGCSSSRIQARRGEVEKRYLSPAEEGRLLRTLDALRLKWSRSWCVNATQAGARAGYMMSVVGVLAKPEDAPAMVERVFREVHRLDGVRKLQLATDE